MVNFHRPASWSGKADLRASALNPFRQTYGVVLYQEQVIQIATTIAGFTRENRTVAAGDDPFSLTKGNGCHWQGIYR